MDYYATLGIDKTATDEEIKKKYRKLSLKHHPDRGGDAEEFKKINEAFQTLGDKVKRQQYDMQRNNPFSNLGGGGVMDPNIDNIMKMFFSGAMPGGNVFGPGIQFGHAGMGMPNVQIFRNGQPVNLVRKPAPITKTVEISLEDAYKGLTHPLHIERWIMYGNERRIEKEKIYVNIPTGIDDGERIVLKDKGNSLNEQVKGDIHIFIKINNNSVFIRDGLELIFKKIITLKQALTGFKFDIKHLNGKTYTINNEPGNIIQPNYSRDIPKLGMIRGNNNGRMIIVFEIKFPDSLSNEQVNKLKNIL